jgi:hypothetical protein
MYVRYAINFMEKRGLTFEEFCEYYIADSVLNDYEKQAMVVILDCLDIKTAAGKY